MTPTAVFSESIGPGAVHLGMKIMTMLVQSVFGIWMEIKIVDENGGVEVKQEMSVN